METWDNINIDTDGDGTPNYLDWDIDNDGTKNGTDTDVDGDGQLNTVDGDIDGDNVKNAIDTDIDGDAIKNALDSDIDGDMVSNIKDKDTDGDGILDAFDTNNTVFGSPRNLERKLLLSFDGRNDYATDDNVIINWENATLMAWINLNNSFSSDGVVVGQNKFQIKNW